MPIPRPLPFISTYESNKQVKRSSSSSLNFSAFITDIPDLDNSFTLVHASQVKIFVIPSILYELGCMLCDAVS